MLSRCEPLSTTSRADLRNSKNHPLDPDVQRRTQVSVVGEADPTEPRVRQSFRGFPFITSSYHFLQECSATRTFYETTFSRLRTAHHDSISLIRASRALI